MKIFLVGFMGSGKSYIGKILAEKLGFQFVDLDSIIENTEGVKISQIFEIHGESYFRKVESDCLHHLNKWTEIVVATGGGAACFHDNMSWMNENGITVYLSVEPQLLASRLANEVDKRPILQGKTGDELLDFIKMKVSEREDFYNQAHVKIHQTENSDDIVFEILEKILAVRTGVSSI